MTWAVLAVMSLLLSGGHNDILTPKMQKTNIMMEQQYQKQTNNPMTSWCQNVDRSVEKEIVIDIYECSKDVEFFVVFDLRNKTWVRCWNFKNTVFNSFK